MISLPPGLGYYGNEPHLSPTSASMFLRCPEQWRRRYLLGEKTRPSGAMVRGKADHAAHEANFAQKIYTHEDLPVSDVLDAYSDAWKWGVDEAGGASEIESDDLGKEKDIGAKVVSAYHTTTSKTIQPLEVELPLERPLGDVLVNVKVDLVREDGIPIERKTTSKKQNSPKPDHALQVGTYAVLLGTTAGELHYAADSGAITTPKESESLLVEPFAQGVEMVYSRVANSVNAMFAQYGPDDPWLGGTTHQWACGFCGYRPNCAYWR